MSEQVKPVAFLDLSDEFNALESEWQTAINETGQSGRFINGPNVEAFEKELADYVGTDYAVAVANGTDALLLSLRALGVGAGDEVITTPYTFFATAEVISLVGATPIFIDTEAHSFNIDPDKLRASITPKTKAIMPVHLFGNPANMSAINAIAEEFSIPVIEDAAQAFGADVDGKRVGSLGKTGCFSFYPTKVLGCYGDGGIITTNDADLVERVRVLKNHGASGPFMHNTAGYNSRLDEIQAALLRIKLRKIDDDIAARRRVAARYDELLADSAITIPVRPDFGGHVFNLYTIQVENRDAVRQALTDNKIPSSLCYPLPLHLQEVYLGLDYHAGDLPVCEHHSTVALSLPVYPAMPDEDIVRICDVLKSASE